MRFILTAPLFRPARAIGAGWVILLGLALALTMGLPARAEHITEFFGSYTGGAEIVSVDGTRVYRDMNVVISETKHGFTVQWTSATHKPDGRIKEKSYSIDFLPTDRHGIYAAAMQRNVFGHEVQLDPMKGEPFVWGRIEGSTLTVFSLFVSDDGGYEMQQYDRTLAEGGLMLEFKLLRNGEQQRSVSTFLERQ